MMCDNGDDNSQGRSNRRACVGLSPPSAMAEERWSAEEAIAGNHRALEALRELILYPFLYSAAARRLGIKWPRGLLLYGPPGTGKTSMVKAVARECDAHLTTITTHSVLRPHAGESEKLLREAFSEARTIAASGKPSVIFIDEIDAICPSRSARREHQSRIVGQLLTLMDGQSNTLRKPLPHVVVVASTNRVEGVDPALRRPGRFDSEIEVNVPTAEERLQILQLYTRNTRLDHDVDLQAISASCHGYVGADIENLYGEAVWTAQDRSSASDNDGDELVLNMKDWEDARSKCVPSITKGIAKEIPKVSWDDIGGLNDVKKKLRQAVEWPIKHADAFERLRIPPVRGVLLHGPPGCSKTTLARAAANAAQASLFSLSGADLYAKYVGEGEAILRTIFQKARLAAPSVVFFDEIDAVAPNRGGNGGNSSGNVTVGERVLSSLLTEMDGLELATGIIVLAATNRPHAIDAALLRPGRFDSVLYVPPPDVDGRYEILRIHTKKMKLGEDVDLKFVAESTEFFTGADLEGLCREAGMSALRENIRVDTVFDRHFSAARDALKPSSTKSQIEEFCTIKFSRHSHRS